MRGDLRIPQTAFPIASEVRAGLGNPGREIVGSGSGIVVGVGKVGVGTRVSVARDTWAKVWVVGSLA